MPHEPNLLMSYGLELVRAGKLDQGLDHYGKAFRLMSALPAAQIIPELRETLLTQFSTQLLKAKDFGATAELLRSPLAQSGGLTASLHFTLGLALMELKKFTEAAEQMRQCLAKRQRAALSPVHKDVRGSGPHHCLAICLKMAGEPGPAGKAFAEAIKQAPGAVPLRLDYARFLADQGQPVQALEMLHQLVSDKPDEMNAWLLGGEIALSRPEFLEFARDWTGEAIKYFAEMRPIMQQRAEALLLSGDVQPARVLWRQASDLTNPRHQAARYLCELIAGGQYPILQETEPAVSLEFVKWYRALLGAGAAELVTAVHARLEQVGQDLPAAGQILGEALEEAERDAVVETLSS